MTPSNGWKLMANRERHEKTILFVSLSPTTYGSYRQKTERGCHDEKSRERRADQNPEIGIFNVYLQNSLFLPSRDNIEKQDELRLRTSLHTALSSAIKIALSALYMGANLLCSHSPLASDSSRQVIVYDDRLHQPPGGPGD